MGGSDVAPKGTLEVLHPRVLQIFRPYGTSFSISLASELSHRDPASEFSSSGTSLFLAFINSTHNSQSSSSVCNRAVTAAGDMSTVISQPLNVN